MDTAISAFYVTFGVQFGRMEDDDEHPLGMFSDGYAVIEAPDYEMAHRIAGAIFGTKWAFLYTERPKDYHAPAGELMRMKWIQP